MEAFASSCRFLWPESSAVKTSAATNISSVSETSANRIGALVCAVNRSAEMKIAKMIKMFFIQSHRNQAEIFGLDLQMVAGISPLRVRPDKLAARQNDSRSEE